MVNLENHTNNIIELVTGFKFLLFIFILALLFKCVIMIKLLINRKHAKESKKQLTILLITIFSAILINATWILKTTNNIFLGHIDKRIITFFSRMTWAVVTLHYHSLALFIESLAKQKKLFKNLRQKIFIPISTTIFIFFIGLAIIQFNNPIKSSLELVIVKAAPVYYLFWILLVSLIITIIKLRSATAPRILKRQFNIFVKVLFVPIALSEFIHFYPIKYLYLGKKYTITAISTFLITYAFYRCIKKIIGLRFLNFKKHVQPKKKLHFIYDFKNILEKLSNTTNTRELIHITKTFFKETLEIPIQKTHLYIIKSENPTDPKEDFDQEATVLTQDESTVEAFLNTQYQSNEIKKFLIKEKIVINDELAFSNFYQEEKTREKILSFLNHLNADMFIPIYQNYKITAYIIVERFARLRTINKKNEFYTIQERDQIIIFANYLGKIIHILKTININHIIKQEKKLHDRLYLKEQEIKQYKESIRSFLIHNKEQNIGIIFYKNRLFTPVNQIAQSLIPINLNSHCGHPTSKAIKKIANQVIEYKSPQTCFIKNNIGQKLVVSGIPNIEKNNVIITIKHPEISDVLKDNISILKDPTKWEYLLYLETTEYGKLINNFIPSDCETFLNFKIEILKAGLDKKAVLINAEPDDLIAIVQLLHHISSKETLEIFEVKNNNQDLIIPMLKKLDQTGTLYIKNIDLLKYETQEQIREYIIYGTYKDIQTNNKEKSNVRILASLSTDIKTVISNGSLSNGSLSNGLFSKPLFDLIIKNQITAPKICDLLEQEIFDIANNIVKKTIKTDEFHHILEFEQSDKKKIIKSCPASINKLKAKVKQILIRKSQKQSIYNETKFDPTYNITDPEIVEAARLGKHALRDPKIMNILWGKFKNQNKIASLLGVNRSSVNRRCKEYNLL